MSPLRKPIDPPAAPDFWELAHRQGDLLESERIAAIKQGFAMVWVLAACAEFNLSVMNCAAFLNLSQSTFERRRKDCKPLDTVASERLDRLSVVALLAEEVFEDSLVATQWLSTPNEALGGNTPVMHCETEIGARQVRRVLQAIEWGGVA